MNLRILLLFMVISTKVQASNTGHIQSYLQARTKGEVIQLIKKRNQRLHKIRNCTWQMENGEIPFDCYFVQKEFRRLNRICANWVEKQADLIDLPSVRSPAAEKCISLVQQKNELIEYKRDRQ